jgi:hypothetical protein
MEKNKFIKLTTTDNKSLLININNINGIEESADGYICIFTSGKYFTILEKFSAFENNPHFNVKTLTEL